MSRPVEYVAVFHPLPWQFAPLRDTAPVILLTGSAGGGKSRLAATKVHTFCATFPGATGLMMRKARESMTNSTVIFTDRKVIGGNSHVRHLQTKNRFDYDNGSILAYGGMFDDKQREQIRSIGQDGSVDIVWMEEANRFTEDDYNELLARMRGKAAPWTQIILTCNPDSPTHWIYKRLILGGEARVYYSKAQDNPHNPDRYIDALASLTGVLGQRLRDGRWIHAEGAVYEGYSEAMHLIDRFEIPAEWRRFRVIDFGYSNPFLCQWWALDPDGRMYRYREIYMSQRTVRAHAEQIKALESNPFELDDEGNPAREPIDCTIADHDAEDRATLAEMGITTRPALKDISPGIQRVAQRLAPAGDGRPRLFLLRDSLVEVDWRMEDAKRPTCTEEEFPAYVWPQAGDGRPVKEVPVKEDDHGCFVAGTLIHTHRGQVPIEQVRVGDLAMTRIGYRPVIAAQPTGCKPIFHLALSDGRELAGTADHPVLVHGRGYIALRALRYGDILATDNRRMETAPCHDAPAASPTSSSIAASSSFATPTPLTGQTATTTRRQSPTAKGECNASTKRYGRTSTVLSHQNMTCTTKTATTSTTRPTISNACPNPATTMHTESNTPMKNWRNSEGKWLMPELPHPLGIARMQDANGTGGSQHSQPPSVSWSPEPVTSAANPMRSTMSPRSAPASAPTPARARIDGQSERITKRALAPTAERSSPPIASSQRKPAPVYVLGVSDARRMETVYNLTVADAHEYYANGILVHNCDATRYAVMYADSLERRRSDPRHAIALSSGPPPEESFRNRPTPEERRRRLDTGPGRHSTTMRRGH